MAGSGGRRIVGRTIVGIALAISVIAAPGVVTTAPPSATTAIDGLGVGASSTESVRTPTSVAFPKARRLGDSIVRQGVVVGVQLDALDAVVRPDGGVAAGFPLPVGTDFFLVEDLFNPDAASPRDPGGAAIGTARTHCTVQPPAGLVISCDVAFEFTDGATMHGLEMIDFRTVTPNEPLTAALAITGGTGPLVGVTGECRLTDREDHATSGISFYDCIVAQPQALVRQR